MVPLRQWTIESLLRSPFKKLCNSQGSQCHTNRSMSENFTKNKALRLGHQWFTNGRILLIKTAFEIRPGENVGCQDIFCQQIFSSLHLSHAKQRLHPVQVNTRIVFLTIGGSRGDAAGVPPPPPNRIDFFRFHIHFR